MSRTRIAIVDHPLVVEGLRLILGDQFDIIGSASTTSQAIKLCSDMKPTVLVIDPTAAEPDGFDTVLQLKSLLPPLKVLMLSPDRHRFALARSLQVGASGYALKKQLPGEVREAIQAVASGNKYVAPQLRGEVAWARGHKRLSGQDRQSNLTQRQCEVLHLLAEGLTNKEIGLVMHISAKTVEFHRASISEIVGLRTVAQLTRFAVFHGLVPSPC